MQDLLEGYSVVLETPVAWGEMDAFQHVNNIVYFRYFESARIVYLEKIGYIEFMERTNRGPILASTQCRFKFPLTYPDRVMIGGRVSSLQVDRFVMDYCVASQRHQKIVAEGQGVVVSYDYELGQKVALPDEIRTRILDLDGKNLETDSS
ncbi:MAG: acyl-CoA thioesterase [bacterium]